LYSIIFLESMKPLSPQVSWRTLTLGRGKKQEAVPVMIKTNLYVLTKCGEESYV